MANRRLSQRRRSTKLSRRVRVITRTTVELLRWVYAFLLIALLLIGSYFAFEMLSKLLGVFAILVGCH